MLAFFCAAFREVQFSGILAVLKDVYSAMFLYSICSYSLLGFL